MVCQVLDEAKKPTVVVSVDLDAMVAIKTSEGFEEKQKLVAGPGGLCQCTWDDGTVHQSEVPALFLTCHRAPILAMKTSKKRPAAAPKKRPAAALEDEEEKEEDGEDEEEEEEEEEEQVEGEEELEEAEAPAKKAKAAEEEHKDYIDIDIKGFLMLKQNSVGLTCTCAASAHSSMRQCLI